MFTRDAQILVSSIDKLINKAKTTGKMDSTVVFLYNTLIYYRDFIQSTIDAGSIVYKDYINILNSYISDFIYRNSTVLCNYKISSNTPISILGAPITTNTAPTITGSTITIPMTINTDHIFSIAEVIQNFADTDGDSYNKIKFDFTGIDGVFTYNSIIITGILEILITDVINLVYTRADNNIFSEVITYRISDNDNNSLYSGTNTITITGTAIVVNQPATIGDIAIYELNRVNTTLTLGMFTSQLTPPYNDPEGDALDAIRIDEISTANLGTFEINGITITEGLIITTAEISAGLFIHIGLDADTISTDSINFSVRDTGSQTWVQ